MLHQQWREVFHKFNANISNMHPIFLQYLPFRFNYFTYKANIFVIVTFPFRFLTMQRQYLTNIGISLEVLPMNALLAQYCAPSNTTSITDLG